MALPNPAAKGEPFEQTKRSPLYLDRALKGGHKAVVVVEGVKAAAAHPSAGDARAVACVAVELSHEQVATLKRRDIASDLIVLDPDPAGGSGTLSCLRQLRKASIRGMWRRSRRTVSTQTTASCERASTPQRSRAWATTFGPDHRPPSGGPRRNASYSSAS